MSASASESISGKFNLNLLHLKKLPWFWALSWSKRWELLELSLKLLLVSLLPICKVDLLGVTSSSPKKWDAETSLLTGVFRELDESRLGVFSCCHENTDEEVWCLAMSRWFIVAWGVARLTFCKNRSFLSLYRNLSIEGDFHIDIKP
jgi:hypothetical protein